MAAFPRSLSSLLNPQALRLPSSLRATLITPRLQPIRTPSIQQSFSSSILRRYASSARTPVNPYGAYATSDPVLRTVMQTRQPVLIYKEPPRAKYLRSVYAWATLATGVGLYCFYWVAHLPQGLPWFVAPTYIVMGTAFCAIGLHVYQRPVRRIISLEVVPSTMGGRLQLRLRALKSPFGKETVITTDIWEATMGEKTVPMIAEISEAERARKQNISQGLEDFNIASRAWEIAARWVEQKWTSFFLRFKFAILQFGMTHIEIDGIKWKIDCTGFLKEDGQGMISLKC